MYTLKLIDFAFSEKVGVPLHQAKGTEQYIAPEQLMALLVNKKHSLIYFESAKADVYSLGIFLFTLFFGMPPFKFNSPEHELVQMLGSGDPKLLECFFSNHPVTKVFNDQGFIP